jgi:hypothetical protein
LRRRHPVDWNGNWPSHCAGREIARAGSAALFLIVLARASDAARSSMRHSADRLNEAAPLDPFFAVPTTIQIFVVDASFLPTSAAVNRR